MNTSATVQPVNASAVPDCAKPIFRWTEDSRILRDCDKSVARMANEKETILS